MKYYGQAEQTATKIVDAFRTGAVPKALATVFLNFRRDDLPMSKWSWSNQLIAALCGASDARGYRQWEAVGRNVRKGERAFPILGPCTRKVSVVDDATGETYARNAVYGFKTLPVFDISQTEGEPLPGDVERQAFIDALPLVEVARHWGLAIGTYNGQPGRALGKLMARQTGELVAIAVGVENLSTWAHELMHAADHKIIGGLKSGQHLDQEIVAELGGAVLLAMIGHEEASDIGGAWEYIQSYAKAEGVEPVAVCEQLVRRICEAVAHVLAAAEALERGDHSPTPEEAAIGEAVAA